MIKNICKKKNYYKIKYFKYLFKKKKKKKQTFKKKYSLLKNLKNRI